MNDVVTDGAIEETSVLVVGGAVVGLAAAMFLAGQDVPVVVVDQSPASSPRPRATGFTPRTVQSAGRPFLPTPGRGGGSRFERRRAHCWASRRDSPVMRRALTFHAG